MPPNFMSSIMLAEVGQHWLATLQEAITYLERDPNSSDGARYSSYRRPVFLQNIVGSPATGCCLWPARFTIYMVTYFGATGMAPIPNC